MKKEFYLLCKSIKDKNISRDMLIAYANSYIISQKLKTNNNTMNAKRLGKLAKKIQNIMLVVIPSYFIIRILVSVIFGV